MKFEIDRNRIYLYSGLISLIFPLSSTTRGIPVRMDRSIACSTPFLWPLIRLHECQHYIYLACATPSISFKMLGSSINKPCAKFFLAITFFDLDIELSKIKALYKGTYL
jgi:hypothetical protein